MWNKNEPSSPAARRQDASAPNPNPSAAAPPPASGAPSGRKLATIGSSIVIKGDLSGQEDLLIEGRVEGGIQLPQHSVTIGKNGRVKADVFGRSLCVEGEVEGNLTGEEEVVIRKTGKVEGNAKAPRVSLENGAQFRGSIDMQPVGSAARPAVSSGSGKTGQLPSEAKAS